MGSHRFGPRARLVAAVAAACLIALTLAPSSAVAKTTTWTGGSPSSYWWSDPGNWDNGVPTDFDDVLFAPVGGTSVIDISPKLTLMDMTGFTGGVLLSEQWFSIGDLTVDGMLELRSGAMLQVNQSLTILGGGFLDVGIGLVWLGGDLTMQPGATASWSGGGELWFVGGGTQTWTDEGTSIYAEVNIGKPPDSRVVLGSTLTLGSLDIQNGTLELSGGLAVLGNLSIRQNGALEVPASTSGLAFAFHDINVTDGRFSVSGSGHTLGFASGSVDSVYAGGSAVFEVIGSPAGDIRLQQDGVAGGDRWVLNHEPTATLTFEHVRVQDSEAVGGIVTATNSADLGNNFNWDFGAGLVTWTGLGPTDLWSDGANWSPHPPLGGDEVRFDPVGGVSVADLPGLVPASMDMTGYTGVLELAASLNVAGPVVSAGTLDLSGHALTVGGNLTVGGSLVATGGTCTVGGALHVTGGILGGTGSLVDVHGPIGGDPGAVLDMGAGRFIVRTDADFRDFATVSFGAGGRLEGRADADYRIDFGGSASLAGLTFEHTLQPVVARLGSTSGTLVVGGPLRVVQGVVDLSGIDVTVGDLTDIAMEGTLKGETEEGTGITLDGGLTLYGNFVYRKDRVRVTLMGAHVGAFTGSLRVEGDSAVVRFRPAAFVMVETGGLLEIAGGTGDLRARLELDAPLHSDNWLLNIWPLATTTFQNVDVTDSDASWGETAVATGDSNNGGYNSNWMFVTTGVEEGLPLRLALDVAPNPFTSSTAVRYALPRPGVIRVEVFDVGGRRVRALVSGHRDAGEHQTAWDGRDDAGRRLGSGTYFVRLRTPAGTVRRTTRLLD